MFFEQENQPPRRHTHSHTHTPTHTLTHHFTLDPHRLHCKLPPRARTLKVVDDSTSFYIISPVGSTGTALYAFSKSTFASDSA